MSVALRESSGCLWEVAFVRHALALPSWLLLRPRLEHCHPLHLRPVLLLVAVVYRGAIVVSVRDWID